MKKLRSISGTTSASRERSRTVPVDRGLSSTGISVTWCRPLRAPASSRSQPTLGSTCRSNVPGSQRVLGALSFDCTCVSAAAAIVGRELVDERRSQLEAHVRARVVEQAAPHAGHVGDHRDAERAELVRRAHAAAQEHGRRPVGARRQHHRGRLDEPLAPAVAHDDARGAAARDDDAIDERVGQDLEVRPAAHGVEVGVGGAEAGARRAG